MKNNMLRYNNDCLYLVKKTIYTSEENGTSFFKAIDNRTKRIVGIKEIVAPDKKSADELKKEINMLITLEKYSRNIPVLYDFHISVEVFAFAVFDSVSNSSVGFDRHGTACRRHVTKLDSCIAVLL